MSTTCSGSSPRMRGTPVPGVHRVDDRGIIPAYAGNTQCAHLDATDPRDHPRVCGEHFNGYVGQCVLAGSSPRMRGTQVLTLQFLHLMGIIPAYAGNTAVLMVGSACRRDHPRVCGEHRNVIQEDMLRRGSSPRIRGTRYAHDRPDPHPGIIPAYAGNTTRIPLGSPA